ncbi:NADH-quinone oxidoreductase subunit N [uncultured Desulfuromusa sp.]|uniref:NADH-quinone oxidoreductase subunit N n=1 Tax=uncultured Desulfuromusa sp. TaxID=219183 RepID=UPI002AA7B47B|nr:NADH-quinone oxidoreductase subunit N [uncultured Desulfuromusa sp.]
MENLVQEAIQNVNLQAIMPSLVLSGFAMVLLMVSVFSKRGSTTHVAWLSIAALIVTGFVTLTGWNNPQAGFAGSVLFDNFATFFSMICIVAAGLTILMSDDYLKREQFPVSEYYSLILFTTAGAMWMASGTDLMTIFLGLEVLSVSLYVLAGFFRNQTRSNEAGLKYFFLGAFSTGFLLYGVALVYGVTGTTKLEGIAAYVRANPDSAMNTMFIAGGLLLLVGFLFKVAAAPFHMWTPDVYQGAPTPITAFMSAGPKAAAFAALMRVMIVGLDGLQSELTSLFWILAVLTMTIGNFVALSQKDLKRMLAYSSISHAGYALVGLVAWNEIGLSAILFYMLVYTFMNMGAFAVLVLVGKQGENNLTLEGIAGLGYKKPVLGVVLSIFLLSLMGMPPTAGFIGKFYIFAGAIKAGYIWLAILGVLNSAVSLYYYLRVMVQMYFKDPEEDFSWVFVNVPTAISIVISLGGVLYLGMFPNTLMQLAKLAGF